MKKSEIPEAAVMLRAIVKRIQTGDLTAPGRVTAPAGGGGHGL
jgi:hypothetical protein